jgi:ribosomal protein L32
MDRLAKIREGDDERRAARSCLFEYSRKSDETLSQYVHRREQQFETAAAMDLQLPPKYRAILLEEGASLAPQGEQNLRTLTGGVLSYEGVSKALRDMDVARERMTVPPTGGLKNFMAEPEDEEIGEQGSEGIDTEDENMILAEIDGQDVGEYEVPEILAVLQEQKKSMKSDSAASGRPSGASDKKGYGGRKRLSVDQLKLVTKCGNCGEKGHWHKECSKPHRPRDPAKKTTAFAYALGHSHFSFTEMYTHTVNAIRQTRISAETGHRTMRIDDFSLPFEVDDSEVSKWPILGPQSFDLHSPDCMVVESYMVNQPWQQALRTTKNVTSFSR